MPPKEPPHFARDGGQSGGGGAEVAAFCSPLTMSSNGVNPLGALSDHHTNPVPFLPVLVKPPLRGEKGG